MFYTRLVVTCAPSLTERLTAELAEAGFDAFIETPDGLEAFAEQELFDRSEVERIFWHYEAEQSSLNFAFDKVEKENWNQQWEDNVEPVVVEGKCRIRAAFHPHDPSLPFDIVITPKMSFGTGHHPTTYLMIQAQMDIDHHNKLVMDAGCGTAILSIMASKLGAVQVECFDIDEWSVVNGKENLEINGCTNVRLRQGSINDFHFPPGAFDIVVANINKNVLLDELPAYLRALRSTGTLILSGFYPSDVQDMQSRLIGEGWGISMQYEREKWAAIVCRPLLP